MTVVIGGLETKSEKIRALLHEGYMRTEVADFLNIRYQHVRKVAVDAGIEGGLRRGLVVVPKSKPIPKVRADVAIDVLTAAGFERLGTWVADGAGGIGLDTSAPRDAGVYVFVVDGLIKYIGVSRAGIRSRMSNYRLGQAGQKTSARVNQIIKECVTAGTVVEIYIAMPPALEWNGLPVITAAGLEAGLIKMIQPPWNKMGVES
ncbi:GIY-YIG nuclease family protein [Mesorhizobium sp. M4A.F.Ca.ET.020.02.1.1]|uniref:GIY-YIG nuclease family protein n=1 Tax=unclassified Mesorhizobium TaxID=325217 RepID=UPI000FD3DE94|nr:MULTISPECIES: GIY-YIG nuclease family protein [unclassified Mesorhizobium]RVD44125.1 GIY-YIG nuclease family protein [Mesorhizobium sp. M4A.F.Ca.ET.020.02.1.1]RWC13195.1 MAG: GIY-YIG nuclease family protein [Mesorhizobium sp.]